LTTWSNVFKLYDLPLTNKKELVENSQVQLTKKLNLATHHINHFAEPIEIEKLAGHYGTPLYIIDENTLHKRVRDLRNAYARFNGHVKLAYSVKANFTPAVLTSFIKDGITFDITSLGELHFLTRCKAPPENMIYTSVTEEFQEYYEVLQSGIRKVVVSSFSGLTNLAKAAHKLAIKPLTMIRVNPEVGVKAEICASYKNGKFGVPLNGGTIDNAAQMVKHLMDNDLLQFEGFHFHLGSQITDFSCFIHAFDKMHNFMTKMKKEFPKFTVNTFDIGGGTPVFYNESVPTPSQMADSYVPRLNRLVESHGPFDLLIESGRYLVAESSMLISKIVNTKEYDEQEIVIVDTGYHLLLDAALLKQEYPQETVSTLSPSNEQGRSTNGKSIHLTGRLCDTYDVFPQSKASDLTGAKIGRYVSFYNVGAYSVVFNMPFHCQTKPAIVMKTMNGEYRLVRRGTSYEQLFIDEGGSLI
jgi:diaminopimelate decarboxylase